MLGKIKGERRTQALNVNVAGNGALENEEDRRAD